MDADLRTAYNYAMGQLMEKEAKTHCYEKMCFFSDEEFKKNYGKICIIKNAFSKLEKKLKHYEQIKNGNGNFTK